MDEIQITRDIICNENRITHLRKLASKLGVKSVSKIKDVSDLQEMCMKILGEEKKEETPLETTCPPPSPKSSEITKTPPCPSLLFSSYILSPLPLEPLPTPMDTKTEDDALLTQKLEERQDFVTEFKVENIENKQDNHEIPNTHTVDLSSNVDNHLIMHKPVVEYFSPPCIPDTKVFVPQEEVKIVAQPPDVVHAVVEEKKDAVLTQKCEERPVSVTEFKVENNENKQENEDTKITYGVKIYSKNGGYCPDGFDTVAYSDIKDIISDFVSFIHSKTTSNCNYPFSLTNEKELLFTTYVRPLSEPFFINEFNYEYNKKNKNMHLKEIYHHYGKTVRQFNSSDFSHKEYESICDKYQHRFVSLPECVGWGVMNDKFEDEGYCNSKDLRSEAEERKQYFLDLSKELNCDNDDHYLLMLYELDEMSFLEWTSNSVRKWLNHSKIWEELNDQRNSRQLYELISKRCRINRWIQERLESQTEYDYAKFMILFYKDDVLEHFGRCVSKTIAFMEEDGFERDEDLFTFRKIYAIRNLIELFLKN